MLVVDDNRHVRAIVVEILKALDVREPQQAQNGEQGLAMLRQNPCDLALVDLTMAPMDGVSFTRAVRNGPDSPDVHLPIIMMTAHAERASVEAARDAGADEFVLKPLTPAALFGRMEAAIQRPRPYVRAPSYFGPDRRRRADPAYNGPPRRAGDRGSRPRAYLEV